MARNSKFILNIKNSLYLQQIPEVPRRQRQHLRTPSIIQNRKSNGSQDIQVHYSADSPRHSLNLTQQQINAALFNSNSPNYSPTGDAKHYQNQELHMAEILVESANSQQRSAFQFDTITPKKSLKPNSTDALLDSGIEMASTSHDEQKTKDDENVPKSPAEDSSSDDSGGFKTPQEKNGVSNRVKRTTIVGNPMFSSQESDLGAPRESLGIDDEMDYEQIMSYFDNLKVG
jgi:hypothetical protein